MTSPNRLRTWAGLAAIALMASVGAQDHPKVTHSQPAAKASAVLAELTKKTGVHLASDPIVGNVPILVSVTDVPLDELMQRIADAVGGELKPENDGWRLVNDQAQRRQEEARELQWAIEAFDRAKTKLRDANKTPARYDDKTVQEMIDSELKARERMSSALANVQAREGARIQMFNSGSVAGVTPALSSARRALDSLPSSVLAGVGPGDRIVYSTSPNRMQSRMPINVAPLVNDFVYNHNLLARAAPQLKQQGPVEIIGGLNPGDPIQGVVETHMVLSRGYRSTTVTVEMKFVDRNGLIVGRGSASVTPDYGAAGGAATSEEGKPIELSELSRQMAVIMAQELAAPSGDRNVMRVSSVGGGGGGAFVTIASGGGNLPKQFPDELLQVFVNPDKVDPAALYVSECYIQAAEAAGKDLVATFPDSIVRDLARVLIRGTVTTGTVLGSSRSFGLNRVDDGDWMTLTPVWANNARETRFDREQAARFFRAVNARGFASLEEIADYSFHLTMGLADRSLDMVYLGLVNKDVGDQFNEYVSMNLDLLRLYGSLSDAMKRSNSPEVSVQVRSLTGNAKRFAERAYYNQATGFQFVGGGGGQGETMAIMMVEEETRGSRNQPPANSILTEPTEALPNGLPLEALVSLTRSMQEGVYASMTGVRGGQLLSAQELGMRQHMVEANFSGGSSEVPQYDKYQPAQVMSVQIRLDLAEFGQPSAMFKDGWTVNGSRPVSYDQLPIGFRNQVEEAKSRFNRPPVNRTGRGGGGG